MSHVVFTGVTDIIILFEDNRCLKLTADQIANLGSYNDVDYIKINDSVFGKAKDEND